METKTYGSITITAVTDGASLKKINTRIRSASMATWRDDYATCPSIKWDEAELDNSHILIGDIAYLIGQVSDKKGADGNLLGITFYGTVTAVDKTGVTMTPSHYMINGTNGVDGDMHEYVYYLSTYEMPNLAAPEYTNGVLSAGWAPSPQGITAQNKYEYVSLRIKTNGVWSDFTKPAIWSKWGDRGQDGDGIMYKYYLSDSADIPTYVTDDKHWTDDPTGVSESQQYEYVVQIKTIAAKKINTDIRSWQRHPDDKGSANWETFGKVGDSHLWQCAKEYDNSHISIGDYAYVAGVATEKVMTEQGESESRKDAKIYGKVTGVSSGGVTMTTVALVIGEWEGSLLPLPSKVALWAKWGEKGEQGVQGPKGNDGTTYYTWIKYADTPTSGMSDNPDGKAYIGLAYNKTSQTESEVYADYTWSLTKGEQGVQGPKGDDGTTYYTWIKYADDASGTNMSNSPDGKLYIGLAYNKTTDEESSTATDYTWALFKGEKGRGINQETPLYYATVSTTGNPETPPTPDVAPALEQYWRGSIPTNWNELGGSNTYIFKTTRQQWNDDDVTYTPPTLLSQLEAATIAAQSAGSNIADWCVANDVTIIDGSTIATGSITADQIDVNSLFVSENFAVGIQGNRNFFSGYGDEEILLDGLSSESYKEFVGNLTFDPSKTVGTTYTISFWAKSPNGPTHIRLYNTNNPKPRHFGLEPVYLTTDDKKLGNEWTHFSYTLVNTDRGEGYSDKNCNRIEIHGPNQRGVLVKKIKVELGNKATPWTPAPEDGFDNVVTSINASEKGVKIKGEKVDITGQVTFSSLSNELKLNAMTCNITSSTGTNFGDGQTGNADATTTLTAYIYEGTKDIDPDGTKLKYQWYVMNNGASSSLTTAATKSITVKISEIVGKSVYFEADDNDASTSTSVLNLARLGFMILGTN